MIGHRHPLRYQVPCAEDPGPTGGQDEPGDLSSGPGGSSEEAEPGDRTRTPGWSGRGFDGPGHNPWMRGRRVGRRRPRPLVPVLLAVALAMGVRGACAARRPGQRVFVGMVFRPVTVVDVSLFGSRRGRRRPRCKAAARLLGLRRS